MDTWCDVVCCVCGERYSSDDLAELREMGDAYYLDLTVHPANFMCPDCWDDYNHMSAEEQLAVCMRGRGETDD